MINSQSGLIRLQKIHDSRTVVGSSHYSDWCPLFCWQLFKGSWAVWQNKYFHLRYVELAVF